MSLWIYWANDNENKATHCAQLPAPCSSASPSSLMSKASPVEGISIPPEADVESPLGAEELSSGAGTGAGEETSPGLALAARRRASAGIWPVL